jgi:CcmD family protein
MTFPLSASLATVGATVLAAQPPSPAQEGFVPIDKLPAPESFPAAPLVIAAYAVAWVVIFIYVWSVWRRLDRVERELKELTGRASGGARP